MEGGIAGAQERELVPLQHFCVSTLFFWKRDSAGVREEKTTNQAESCIAGPCVLLAMVDRHNWPGAHCSLVCFPTARTNWKPLATEFWDWALNALQLNFSEGNIWFLVCIMHIYSLKTCLVDSLPQRDELPGKYSRDSPVSMWVFTKVSQKLYFTPLFCP